MMVTVNDTLLLQGFVVFLCRLLNGHTLSGAIAIVYIDLTAECKIQGVVAVHISLCKHVNRTSAHTLMFYKYG